MARAAKKTTRRVPVIDDIVNVPYVLPRLEQSIGNLAKATTDLSVGVAAHTQRMDHMESRVREQQSDIAKLSDEQKSDFRTLDGRIATVKDELTEKIVAHTETVTKHIDSSVATITTKLEEKHGALGVRLGRVERWQNLIVGGAIVIGFLLSAFFVKLLAKVVPWLSFLN